MDELNWKFLEQVKKNTLSAKGSVMPLGMFVEYQSQGLVEGTSSSARITQYALKLMDEEAHPNRKVKVAKKRKPWER